MKSIIIGAAAIPLLAFLFYLVISPIIGIYHAIKNQDLEERARAGWAVGIFLIGPLAAWVYYVRHAHSKLVRIFHGGLIALFSAIVCASFFAVGLMSQFTIRSLLAKRSHPAIEKLAAVNRAKVEESIDQLVAETRKQKWYEYERAQTFMRLDELLAKDLGDGEFTLAELDEWFGNMVTRAHLDEHRFAAQAQQPPAPTPDFSGRYHLKYVTCQDPSRLTPQGQALNQDLRTGKFSQQLDISKTNITVSSNSLEAPGANCAVTQARQLTIAGNQLTGAPTNDIKALPSGNYSTDKCAAKATGASTPWARVAVQDRNLLYLEDKNDLDLCGHASAFWTYDRQEILNLTGNLQKEAAASLEASAKGIGPAIAKLSAGKYDEAMELAKAERVKHPATRTPAAVLEAAEALKADPSGKLKWTMRVMEAAMQDLHSVAGNTK